MLPKYHYIDNPVKDKGNKKIFMKLIIHDDPELMTDRLRALQKLKNTIVCAVR